MLKNRKPLWIILAQAFLFYLFPMIAKPFGPMGMVLVLVIATFALARFMGRITAGKAKWLYPVLVAILFVPTVFIYYNESALVQAIWYFVVSLLGLVIGTLENSSAKK